MKIQDTESGQSLIEVLIALAASVAVIAAIAVTVITSLSNVEFTKNQNLATQYSREGLELVRQKAKDNWLYFSSHYTSVYYCLDSNDNLSVMVGSCPQNVGIFKRQIQVFQNDTTKCNGNTKIISMVLWSDSKCLSGDAFCHDVQLDTCFANINTIQGP